MSTGERFERIDQLPVVHSHRMNEAAKSARILSFGTEVNVAGDPTDHPLRFGIVAPAQLDRASDEFVMLGAGMVHLEPGTAHRRALSGLRQDQTPHPFADRKVTVWIDARRERIIIRLVPRRMYVALVVTRFRGRFGPLTEDVAAQDVRNDFERLTQECAAVRQLCVGIEHTAGHLMSDRPKWNKTDPSQPKRLVPVR